MQGIPCKRRGCSVCGPMLTRMLLGTLTRDFASYLAAGVPLGKLVLTWRTAEAERPAFKPKALRHLNTLIRKLRQRGPVEYCWTAELTERGRLHLNVVVAGWRYLPQKVLQVMWGMGIVHVRRVLTAQGTASESAKRDEVQQLAAYLTKASQVPGPEWGRRVGFSNGWCHAPLVPFEEREGLGAYHPMTDKEIVAWWCGRRDGKLVMTDQGYWVRPEIACRCFGELLEAPGPGPPGPLTLAH